MKDIFKKLLKTKEKQWQMNYQLCKVKMQTFMKMKKQEKKIIKND